MVNLENPSYTLYWVDSAESLPAYAHKHNQRRAFENEARMDFRMIGVAAALTGFVALYANDVAAEEWKWLPGVTSANLAAAGWEIKSSAGLSWPDGRQSVVTFWQYRPEPQMALTVRCFTAFAPDEQQTGDACKRPAAQKIPPWYLDPLVQPKE